VASGQIAVKVLILHPSTPPPSPAPKKTIPPIVSRHMKTVTLNFRNTFGSSSKKVDSVTSLAVAPQDMGMLRRWEMMARERWRDRPPRKMVRRGMYFRFSRTGFVEWLDWDGVGRAREGR
jgi:hypothetical protein